jgi:hypothetical protein
VDSGEFFNLFDSFCAPKPNSCAGVLPLYDAIFAQENLDLLAVAPHSILVRSSVMSLPLHDTPGVEGGLGADREPTRDKENDEDLM